jgi:hypothetical protein
MPRNACKTSAGSRTGLSGFSAIRLARTQDGHIKLITLVFNQPLIRKLSNICMLDAAGTEGKAVQ